MAHKTKNDLIQELSGLDVDVCAELGVDDPEKATRDDLVGLLAIARAPAGDDVEVVDGDAVEVMDDQPGDEPAAPEAEATEDEATGMSLAVMEEREYALQPVHALPSGAEWEALTTISLRLAGTPFVPTAYRGQPESVLAAMMYGREIGLGPMQALQKIHMIDGKPSMSADLMLAQLRKGGVLIVASESTRERAWISAKRRDTGEVAEVEWTIEEARQVPAKERGQNITLAEKGTWKAYPSDMLWARCVGRLARRLGSDLLGGMVYSAEEVADWNEGDYGGTGYGTASSQQQPSQSAARPATRDGIELRADAPLGWGPIKERLEQLGPGAPWKEWQAQAFKAITGIESFNEADDDAKRDAGIRIANAVAHLAATLAGRDFPPPSRDEVRAAFAHPDAAGAELLGPDGPMDPDEAQMMKAAAEARQEKAQGAAEEPADAQGASGAGTEPSEGAEGAQEAAEEVTDAPAG